VAGWDHDKVQRVLDWPIREMLLAFVAELKSQALAAYQSALLIWATRSAFNGKLKKPPLPEILREK
jgi:hypothetical protein